MPEKLIYDYLKEYILVNVGEINCIVDKNSHEILPAKELLEHLNKIFGVNDLLYIIPIINKFILNSEPNFNLRFFWSSINTTNLACNFFLGKNKLAYIKYN